MSSSIATKTALPSLTVAPARVWRTGDALSSMSAELDRLGRQPFVIGGDRTLKVVRERLQAALKGFNPKFVSYAPDCCETSLDRLKTAVETHGADCIIGVGGGKALDTAKLVAHRCGLPIVTIPTSAATCAAWTALSNVYSPEGAFLYDVPLSRCPDLLVLDYDLVESAPQRTLVAGIGDAIAKWYEASVSSGRSQQTLIVAAVQQARVLRDLLLQKSALALEEPGSNTWREVVDATVLLAGVIGGLGGAQCRTVAAHAVHNGLTHLKGDRPTLHGEKVAYGILVQLRLEETIEGNQLAAAARDQLLPFYDRIGLPKTLADLGLAKVPLSELQVAAQIACQPESDLHHLPFPVVPEQLMAAMVSTTVPIAGDRDRVCLEIQ